MPLFAKAQREPFSRGGGPSDDVGETAQIIRGAAYARLRSALEKYLRKRSSGRSFVISGNRGIGKSTMVLAVVEDLLVRSQIERGELTPADSTSLLAHNDNSEQSSGAHTLCRPLLVFLSGPDIIREQLRPADPPSPALATSSAPPQPGAGTSGVPAPPAAPPPTPKPAPTEAADRVASSDNLLRQIARALHVSLSREFARRYELTVAPRGSRPELVEAWAQLGLELTGGAKVQALRRFWELGGRFEQGVLFRDPVEKDRQGLCELTALDASADAYRIAIGQVTEANSLTLDDRAREDDNTWVTQLKTLTAPVAGLLGGALTGFGVHSTTTGATQTWASIGAALLAGLVLTFSLAPKRSATAEAVLKFSPDTGIGSLTWRLANVVDRLFRAGLAPVFVIDELDKATPKGADGKDWLSKQAQELKCLLTERSFFCFLTGRDFAEKLHVERAERLYPPSYTMFSEYLFINYLPLELHVYLRERIRWQLILPETSEAAENDQLQMALLPFVVLFRAEMHPIDVRRELNGLIGENDELKLFSGPSLPPADAFALLFQIAIESVLSSEEVERRIRKDARFALLAIDAVYYAPRSWRVGSELDTSEDKIEEYLKKRRGPEESESSTKETKTDEELKPLPPGDRALLLSCALQVIDLIRQPQGVSALLEQDWVLKRFDAGDDADRKDQLRARLKGALPRVNDLLEPKPGSEAILLWRYDADGLQIVADPSEVTQYLRRFRQLTTQTDKQLFERLGFGIEKIEGEFCLVQQPMKWQTAGTLAASLKGARAVGAAAVQLRANTKALKDYVDVLAQALPRVWLACSICRVLEPTKPLTQSLPILAAALDLQSLADDARGARIAGAWDKLSKFVPITAPTAPPTTENEFANALAEHLKLLETNARPQWEQVTKQFWLGWRQRLEALARGGTVKSEPDWPDVAWQLSRPAKTMLLPARWERASAGAWTEIALAALSQRPASDEVVYPAFWAPFAFGLLRSPELAVHAAERIQEPELASVFARQATSQKRRRLIVVIANDQIERRALDWPISEHHVGLVVPRGMVGSVDQLLAVLARERGDDSWILIEATATEAPLAPESLLDALPELRASWPASRRAQLFAQAPKGPSGVARALGLAETTRVVVGATSIDDAVHKVDAMSRVDQPS